MLFAKENDEVLRLGLQVESIKWNSRRIFQITRHCACNDTKLIKVLYLFATFAELDILSTVRFFFT